MCKQSWHRDHVYWWAVLNHKISDRPIAFVIERKNWVLTDHLSRLNVFRLEHIEELPRGFANLDLGALVLSF